MEEYARSIGFDLDGEHFVATYERVGWKLKGQPIKSWKACVVTWKKRDEEARRNRAPPARDPGPEPDWEALKKKVLAEPVFREEESDG